MSTRNFGLSIGVTAQSGYFQVEEYEIQVSVRPKEGNYLIEGEGTLTKLVDLDESDSDLFDISVSLISPETQVRYTPSEVSKYLKHLCCNLMMSSISESQADTDQRAKQVRDCLLTRK